jgi:hypothetical protein
MNTFLAAAGEACRMSLSSPEGSLTPALFGCVCCATRMMITVPALGVCETCGADLQPLAPLSAEARAHGPIMAGFGAHSQKAA